MSHMKISDSLLKLVPYKPGKPISETQREYNLQVVYKLASNENPLGPSPKAMQALYKAINELHLYPDATHYELLQLLSKTWNYPVSQLSLGNGSDEIIDLLTRIFCEPGQSVLTSRAAFNAYEVSAKANRANFITTPMTSEFKFDVDALIEKFKSEGQSKQIRLLFVSNPNNPTGAYLHADEMKKFFDFFGNRDDMMIVFDEAYNEFVRATDYQSAQALIPKYKNLVVLRTFSKIYGLAGIRLGAMIGPEWVVDVYNRIRKPFNVNNLADVAAMAAIQDTEFLKKSQEICWQGVDYFYAELGKLNLPYIPSQGNFVMFDTQRDAQLVFEHLLRRGIILRPVLNYGFKTHLRISVGLPHENAAAMDALSKVLLEIPILPV